MSPPHALAPHDRDPVMEERGSPRPSALDGARIMIVEDEYFVAARLERSLEQEGATVVGVFATVETALAFLDGGEIDIALLDINLQGEQSFPVVDRLIERGVPSLFLSGYDADNIPLAYRDVARLQKPVTLSLLLAAIVPLARDKAI